MMRTKEFMVVATFVLIYTFIISQWQILFGHTAHPETRFLLYPYTLVLTYVQKLWLHFHPFLWYQ